MAGVSYGGPGGTDRKSQKVENAMADYATERNCDMAIMRHCDGRKTAMGLIASQIFAMGRLTNI